MAIDNSTKLNVRLRMILAVGYADLSALTKDLITTVQSGTASAADVSKAFQTLYRKSGSMEAATLAAQKRNGFVCTSTIRDAVGGFRAYLEVIAGTTRESQEVVIGDLTLKNDERRKLLVDALTDAIAYLEETIAADEKAHTKYPASLLNKA
jgi:hypothetical protein